VVAYSLDKFFLTLSNLIGWMTSDPFNFEHYDWLDPFNSEHYDWLYDIKEGPSIGLFTTTGMFRIIRAFIFLETLLLDKRVTQYLCGP
jgi:hypothetical protein